MLYLRQLSKIPFLGKLTMKFNFLLTSHDLKRNLATFTVHRGITQWATNDGCGFLRLFFRYLRWR
jgi:hypothetical protein